MTFVVLFFDIGCIYMHTIFERHFLFELMFWNNLYLTSCDNALACVSTAVCYDFKLQIIYM